MFTSDRVAGRGGVENSGHRPELIEDGGGGGDPVGRTVRVPSGKSGWDERRGDARPARTRLPNSTGTRAGRFGIDPIGRWRVERGRSSMTPIPSGFSPSHPMLTVRERPTAAVGVRRSGRGPCTHAPAPPMRSFSLAPLIPVAICSPRTDNESPRLLIAALCFASCVALFPSASQ